MLLYRLLASIEDGARLVFVGDVDQLPSVGAGNALKDMIRSGRLKCVRLTEIFRQAGQSAIVVNAHKINSGEHPDLRRKTDDFFFMSRRGVSECVSAVVDLAASRLPDYVKAESPYDVQVLTPTRKGNLGVVSLNAALQAAINPASPLRREMEFKGGVLRERDKVMQIKNNYNISWRVLNKNSETVSQGTGVFNGDEGIVKTVDAAARTVTVVYDGERLVDYDFSMLEELELAYAVTIHKSQGSEYKAVVIPIFGGPKPLMSRNLLYTAITRAKSLAVLVGLHETIMGMVDNDREVSRHTALCARLQCFMKEGV
jgi:exodeoxyribonuclease V alpha subunit